MWSQIFSLLLLVASAENGPGKNSLGGVKSLYTEKLQEHLNQVLSEAPKVPVDAQEIWLECYKTEGDPLYIGVRQKLVVDSPLKRVAEVVEDIETYKDIFPGFEKIKIESKANSRWITYWEQKVPIPFVPNVKYRMIYEIGEAKENSRTYRYQLLEKSSLTLSDGFIILQAIGADQTLYTEVDFFNAEWGAAKIFGQRRIWTDAVEGLVLSDLAIKLKSAHPEWDGRKIKKAAEKSLQSKWIKDCVSNQVAPDF